MSRRSGIRVVTYSVAGESESKASCSACKWEAIDTDPDEAQRLANEHRATPEHETAVHEEYLARVAARSLRT